MIDISLVFENIYINSHNSGYGLLDMLLSVGSHWNQQENGYQNGNQHARFESKLTEFSHKLNSHKVKQNA